MAWQSMCSFRLEWRWKVEMGRVERRRKGDEEEGVKDEKKVGGDKSIA